MNEDDPVLWVEWSDHEKAYITNRGESYKKTKYMPPEVRKLIRPIPAYANMFTWCQLVNTPGDSNQPPKS